MSYLQKINVMAKMRDGVKLSLDIRLPEKWGPFPAVLVRNPYNNNVSGTPENERLLKLYLDAGYAYVTQDVRGKYDSEGEFSAYDEEEDGYDTVEWLATQSWCNGKVGMSGASYCGLTQLAAAKLGPKHLLAITPSVMGGDMFKCGSLKSGVPQLGSIAWQICNTGRTDKPLPLLNWNEFYKTLPLSNLDAAAGFDSPIFKEMLKHPVYDSYWKRRSLDGYYNNINAPVFLLGGWYDKYSAALIEVFCKLVKAGKKAKLLVGPWTHGLSAGRVGGQMDYGGASVIDIEVSKKKWLDRYLKDQKNGMDTEKPVRIFVMGINEWREEESWPLKKTKNISYYPGCKKAANSLYGDGFLSNEPAPGRGEDSYVYDPLDPVTSIGGSSLIPACPAGAFDQSSMERRNDMLIYTTEELRKPLEVTGFVKMELFISTDVLDTDFIARLCDVSPDGKSINLCDGIARARFREGFEREVMLEKDKVYKIEIEMDVTANVFLPGHKIRLELTSSCFPRFARNLNTGGEIYREIKPKIARTVIHHSKSYPSRLILPTIIAKK